MIYGAVLVLVVMPVKEEMRKNRGRAIQRLLSRDVWRIPKLYLTGIGLTVLHNIGLSPEPYGVVLRTQSCRIEIDQHRAIGARQAARIVYAVNMAAAKLIKPAGAVTIGIGIISAPIGLPVGLPNCRSRLAAEVAVTTEQIGWTRRNSLHYPAGLYGQFSCRRSRESDSHAVSGQRIVRAEYKQLALYPNRTNCTYCTITNAVDMVYRIFTHRLEIARHADKNRHRRIHHARILVRQKIGRIERL